MEVLMDEVAVEIHAPCQSAQLSTVREAFPPPATMWRLCAWHDHREPPAGVSVTHIMCQMCYDGIDAAEDGK